VDSAKINSQTQNAVSCTVYGYFGSPRVVVSCCKTYSRSAVMAEVASSSLVVPATFLLLTEKFLPPWEHKGTTPRPVFLWRRSIQLYKLPLRRTLDGRQSLGVHAIGIQALEGAQEP
jgi:hypothetical protein